jgi:anti-sigma factor (TIGR02949 family)
MSDRVPINCEDALRLLAAFLDQELPADDRQAVERHLDTCRSCFSRAEFELRLKREMSRLGREESSATFERRVRGLIASFSTAPAADPADGPQA